MSFFDDWSPLSFFLCLLFTVILQFGVPYYFVRTWKVSEPNNDESLQEQIWGLQEQILKKDFEFDRLQKHFSQLQTELWNEVNELRAELNGCN